ncbi:MAG: hypothetical protein WAK16_00720 [Candidatus Cybelea sp.]
MSALASRRRNTFTIAAIAAVVLTSGCGGSPNTPNGPYVGFPGNPGPPPPRLVSVNVTVTIPAAKRGVGPQYLSYNTESLAIQLVSVNGNGVTGVNPTIMNTLPSSNDCKAQAQATVCTAVAKGSPGDDIFAVTGYAGKNATGAVLAVGTVKADIGSGGGRLGITNEILTLNGIIASLTLSVSPNETKRGLKTTASVSLRAYDASGAEITGPGHYTDPIVLVINGDGNHAFSLHYGKSSGESLTIAKPADGITLTYDGDKQASPITVQASVDGPNGISKSAGFALRGKQPPPPVGTIYALNSGSNSGQGATVTEYDGKAKGNSSPERTLMLDKKLYAVSIAVDSSNNLYVGYFDNNLGYTNGVPDANNEIAIYASGASGNDQPTATLVEDPKTSTTIFPIFMAFDPSDRLVTYGATTVDGNTGDAVLTYAKGSSGKKAPEYGFAFSSPTLYYAGPTGLAIDAGNNFYLNGAFKSGFATAYGLYVNSAADIGNPGATPTRTIPWSSYTGLTPGLTTDVALDKSGEIFIGNVVKTGSGSGAACQAAANVYAAGTGSGSGKDKLLRRLTLDGIRTQGSDCTGSRNPLVNFFPEVQIYGTSLFVADDFDDAIDGFSAGARGTVKPFLQISGSATQLDAPVALAITSLSGRAKALSVTGARAGILPLKHQTLNKGRPST